MFVMYRAKKGFWYMGTDYKVGDTVPDEQAVCLGSRVEYVFTQEANVIVETAQKQKEEKPKRKYTPRKIAAKNKAILTSKKNK